MPHNLDIEISALRKGWGEWCEDYQAMESDLLKLRAFAKAVFEASDWPLGGDMDGFELQELGEKHGLLRQQEVTESCGEGCQCEEYNGPLSKTDTAICYKKTPLLLGSQDDTELK